MGDASASLSSFAAAHGLEAVASVDAGPLTPLLVESGAGRIAPAARGPLGEGMSGAIGQLTYTRNGTFRFARLAHSAPPGFSFELAYGALLCSTEERDPDPAAFARLAAAAAHVTARVAGECGE